MAWIKRNLFFVLGAVVALGLLVFAGLYTYTGLQQNTKEKENRKQKYEDLKRLYNLNPHPGFGKVDNVKAAREHQAEILAVLARATNHFQRPPAIPPSTNVSSSEFQAALRRTVDQLTRDAANASVLLPPDYKFSFYQQFRLLNFAPGSLEPLAVQLGEIKAICEVLMAAKINSLDAIQRERVSPDDSFGPQTDYLGFGSQSNDLAVVTPYQITFRSFSAEIAHVLAGFANSSHGIIVQSIDVRPTAALTWEAPGAAPGASYQPAPYYRPRSAAEEDGFMSRFPSASAIPAPAYAPSPSYSYSTPSSRAGPAGSQTILNERPLRVTLTIQIVKLLPRW